MNPDRKLHVEDPGQIPAGPGEFSGVYLGSAFLMEAVPGVGTLLEQVRRARERGLTCHLEVPFLSETELARVRLLCDALAREAPGTEVISNDLGLLGILGRTWPLVPVAGRLLAGQRTDPRIPGILEAAFADRPERGRTLERSFREVAAANPEFSAFLASLGVDRIEVQHPVQGVQVPPGRPCTVHVPWVAVAAGGTWGPAPMDSLLRIREGRAPGAATVPLVVRGNGVFYAWPPLNGGTGADRVVVHVQPS